MATAKTSNTPKPATPTEKHAARIHAAMFPLSDNPVGVVGRGKAVKELKAAAAKVWGDADTMLQSQIESWAANSPATVAGLFVQFCNLGADAYEKANEVDGSLDGRASSWEAARSEYGAAAEYLAALFGLTLDWPGLYPSMQLPPTVEHPNGRTEHGSTNPESVYRAFTWAEGAKVEELKAAARSALPKVSSSAMVYSRGDHGDRVYLRDRLNAALDAFQK